MSAGLAVFGVGLGLAKGPEKPVTISLVDLGQQTPGGRPQVPGSTQATVNFVGDHHLLVTFPVRRLMKRLAECEPDDEDRMIDAVLVDVPSGKVAARASWRVHDSGQYLWDLGQGRFLLRVKNRLLTVAPLDKLLTEHPFEEKTLLAYDRQVVGVLVSAEEDLLTVETRARQAGGAKSPDGPVEVNFYRMEEEDKGGEIAVSAGRVLSRVPVELPMTRDGYLDTSEEKKGRWVFDYISHGGKKTELAPYDTTCYPFAKFVSRSEFVAFGCRGSADKLEIGGFDMRGAEMWQQNFYDAFVHPTFSFAPEAGRFALGRAITVGAGGMMGPGANPDDSQLSGQDVEVLQAHSGKQIFHTVVTPVQRAGQNFALAPDGMEIAVIRGAEVELHRLPGMSGRDRQEVKEAREVALERASGAIVLPTRSRVVASATEREDADGYYKLPPPALVKQETPAVAPKPVEHTVENGDKSDDGPRKAPTLYKPGEAGSPQ